jgi:hypothetical protein
MLMYRSVSDRFGVSKSTSIKSLMLVVDGILRWNVAQHLISWPTPDEQTVIEHGFRNSYGFPGKLLTYLLTIIF